MPRSRTTDARAYTPCTSCNAILAVDIFVEDELERHVEVGVVLILVEQLHEPPRQVIIVDERDLRDAVGHVSAAVALQVHIQPL